MNTRTIIFTIFFMIVIGAILHAVMSFIFALYFGIIAGGITLIVIAWFQIKKWLKEFYDKD